MSLEKVSVPETDQLQVDQDHQLQVADAFLCKLCGVKSFADKQKHDLHVYQIHGISAFQTMIKERLQHPWNRKDLGTSAVNPEMDDLRRDHLCLLQEHNALAQKYAEAENTICKLKGRKNISTAINAPSSSCIHKMEACDFIMSTKDKEPMVVEKLFVCKLCDVESFFDKFQLDSHIFKVHGTDALQHHLKERLVVRLNSNDSGASLATSDEDHTRKEHSCLMQQHNELLKKYAEARNTIDELRTMR